jgi:hypothetical protein
LRSCRDPLSTLLVLAPCFDGLCSGGAVASTLSSWAVLSVMMPWNSLVDRRAMRQIPASVQCLDGG